MEAPTTEPPARVGEFPVGLSRNHARENTLALRMSIKLGWLIIKVLLGVWESMNGMTPALNPPPGEGEYISLQMDATDQWFARRVMCVFPRPLGPPASQPAFDGS